MPKEKYIKNIEELDKKIVKRTAQIEQLIKRQRKYYDGIAVGKNWSLTEAKNSKERQKKITKLAQENVKNKVNRTLNVIKLKQTSRPKSSFLGQ